MTGNVGIGVSDPQSALHVSGTAIANTFNAPSGNWLTIANGAGSGQINLQGGNILLSNANVGIGTASPGTKLQLHGSGGSGAPLRMVSDSAGAEVGIAYYRNTDESLVSAGDIWVHGVNTFGAGDRNYGFGCNITSHVLTMLATGNVGIGSTIPISKLDVNGVLRIRGSDTTNYYNTLLLGTSADTARAISMLNSNMTNGTIMYHTMGKANSAYNQMEIAYNHVSDGSFSNFISIGLHTVPQTLCITGGSNVGIGTTVPVCRLTVGQDASFADRAVNPFVSQMCIKGNSQGGRIYIGAYYTGGQGVAGSIQMSDYFSSLDHGAYLLLNPIGGNVGIGTSTPGYALHVQGAIYASGEITGLSDQRRKTGVEPLDNSLENISKLQGVSYYRTDDEPEKKRIGLLAQAVAEVYPEAVSYDKTNDLFSLNYMALVAPLIEAVKELKAEVAELRQRLDQ